MDHDPAEFTASVVGPENPETTGGLLVVVSKRAVQYALPGFAQYIKVQAAGALGDEREHELHPSFQLLHDISLAGSIVVATHCPSDINAAPSAFIMQRLPYVVGTGLQGVVMHTIGFPPHTGLYSFVHADEPTVICNLLTTSV